MLIFNVTVLLCVYKYKVFKDLFNFIKCPQQLLMWVHAECHEFTIFTKSILSPTGKAFVLLFKSVTIEDTSEIKFSAEKASSTAKLRIKGNILWNCAA